MRKKKKKKGKSRLFGKGKMDQNVGLTAKVRSYTHKREQVRKERDRDRELVKEVYGTPRERERHAARWHVSTMQILQKHRAYSFSSLSRASSRSERA